MDSRNIDILKELLEALKAKIEQRFSSEQVQDMENFYRELIISDKANGFSKRECFLKGKYTMQKTISEGCPISLAKQADEILLKVLNEIYSDEPPIDNHNQLDIAFDCLRDIIMEGKKMGDPKEKWENRASNDYVEAISEGKCKEGCYEALERMLKVIDEVYAEDVDEVVR